MSMPVDLRSDTLTLPTEPMRKAMYAAEVGDDVFGEDPTIRALEEVAAQHMGLEAGLFVPSGTMGNQIALLTHCRLGDDVLIGEGAHSFLYEAGGAAAIAGVQMSTVGQGGHFTPGEITAAIQEIDPGGHVPPTRLLMVENTHNKGGGKVMTPEMFSAVVEVARSRDLAVHIDGARIFNAAAACEAPVSAWGRQVDSISFCLSKGLGAPGGSVLCGTQALGHRRQYFRVHLGLPQMFVAAVWLNMGAWGANLKTNDFEKTTPVGFEPMWGDPPHRFTRLMP